MDKHSIESVNNKYPKLTRESIVRQEVQSLLEKKNYKIAVELLQKYTDTGYIDNIRKRTLVSRRPEGHSFKTVKILKDKFDTEDKYLIFEFSDGSDGRGSYVINSIKKKVELIVNLDKDGSHWLSTEVA